MRHKSPVVAAATLVLLLLGTVPASADQLRPKDDPKASDNLSFEGRKCATQRDKHEGVVVAVIKACQRFYLLAADSEDDEARDYGVFWLQSTIDPRNGWCATAVSSDMVLPLASRIVSTTPADAVATSKRRRLKTDLTVDAAGHATTEGSLSQTSTMYPDELAPELTKDDSKRRFRVSWTGSEDATLAFVSGVQVSWKTEDGPPKTTRFGLRKYTLRQKESC